MISVVVTIVFGTVGYGLYSDGATLNKTANQIKVLEKNIVSLKSSNTLAELNTNYSTVSANTDKIEPNLKKKKFFVLKDSNQRLDKLKREYKSLLSDSRKIYKARSEYIVSENNRTLRSKEYKIVVDNLSREGITSGNKD